MPKKTTHDMRDHVGQLLIFGFDGLAMDGKLRITLSSLQPGGVVLFARNIQEPGQTWELLHECQASVGVPLLLCVDMEGGTVDRLKNVVAPAPSAEEVANTGNARLFRMHGNIIGLEARALGFNTDFAPVLDLGFDASRSVLTSRTASSDPEGVMRYAREFLRGLKAAKVLGCGKHFPGLGEANLDSHKDLPVVHKSRQKMWAEDLAPYRGLHRHLPLVMVAHAAYPEVTRDSLPASLSRKWMRDTLRKKLGYRGLIVSDDLEMGGALAAGSIEDVAVGTLRAGADIFLVCHNHEFVWRAYEAVLREAERDRRFAAHVRQAAVRVRAFKKRATELRGFPAPPRASVIQTLRKIMNDYSRIVAEIRA
ncbi:MAG TPA: beta-N-acetylhexosaminidase [Verrucomicrobiae bacterium]|jgi:beta-N-acetylhexosaminidase|nr:beta-N-acetylhexosaminidase [Verrucomicrobiae bacterium]